MKKREKGLFRLAKKKGLSTIVITLIIILISLVAVGIIWVVVRNVINTGTKQVSLGQFTLDAKIMNVNVDNNANNVSLTVRRNAGQGEFSKMNFVFSDGRNSEVITQPFSLNQLEEKGFTFHLAMNVSNLISISIVPFVKQDNQEVLGNTLDKYTIGTQTTIPFVCVPATCGGLGYACGNWTNGTCAGSLNCGTCSGGFVCNSAGSCVASCAPTTCASLGYTCGSGYANGTCSGTLNCGNCSGGYNCVSGSCQMTTSLCNNLVLLMHFDKNSSVGENNTLVYDWSGNGNYGFPKDTNLTNSDLNTPPVINITNGRFNSGAGFDGIDDYIRIPKTPSLSPNFYNGTISAWVYLNISSSSAVVFISSYSYGSSGTWNLGKTWSDTNFFSAFNSSGGDVNKLLSDTVNLQLNTWTHYTVTWNDTGIYGYINGALKSANYSKTEFSYFKMYNAWGNYISIGMLSNSDPADSWGLKGKIDDFAIWNRSLTPNEISNIYNSGIAINC